MSSRPFRVLVTRSAKQASALADKLRVLGAEPVLLPTIETADPTSFQVLDNALAQLQTFHWLLFTSANAVEVFGSRRGTLQAGSMSRKPNPRIAVIGPATARALGELGLSADLQPAQPLAEPLTELLLPHARQPDGSPTRFLLVRAEEARDYLPETLRAAGAEVVIAPAYRTVVPTGTAERLSELLTGGGGGQLDAVTFTSSSTARNLFTLLQEAELLLPESVTRASIGPVTSATLADFGFPPHLEAPRATVESLAETLVRYLNVRQR